jgi:cytochrome c-type biogenesis protein CcmH/NrfG
MSSELDEIRRLYYGATRATITRDFDRAIDLLKKMADEAERERATVYMQGLAEMKAQWTVKGSRSGR